MRRGNKSKETIAPSPCPLTSGAARHSGTRDWRGRAGSPVASPVKLLNRLLLIFLATLPFENVVVIHSTYMGHPVKNLILYQYTLMAFS